MYRYKRILVNLNLDENDANLIKHASIIAQMANSEKIYLLYTEKRMEIPVEVLQEYPQITESVADFARDKIRESIKDFFDKKNKPETAIIVQEGQALDEILKQVRMNGIDLILHSLSKEHSSQSRNLATKIARKAPCSVLLIPIGTELNLQNIAIPIDFSDHSADAMDSALAFAKVGQGSKLIMMHVYSVPTGFYKTGKSYEEFSEIMKTNAEKRFAKFITRFETKGIEIEDQYLLDDKPVKVISKAVRENEISFLAIGARGRGAGAAVMLGSICEALIENLDIPILAVKKKGTGLNILDAIFN